MKTRGQLEAELGQVVARFYKEYTGQGPYSTRAAYLGDCVMVRCRGVLTSAERRLLDADDGPANQESVRTLRRRLVLQYRAELEAAVRAVISGAVVGLVYDVLPPRDESVLVLTLDTPAFEV